MKPSSLLVHHALNRRQFVTGALALSAAACAPTASTLTLSLHPWPGYEFIYLAQNQGLLAREIVQLHEVPAATASLRALEAGTADAACITLDEAIGVCARGVALAVVAVLDFSIGGDALVAAGAIQSLADLRGKTVGVEQTAVGAIMLDAVLSAAALRPQDVRVVYMVPNEHEAAMAAKRADALITYEPVKSRLLQAGAHELYSSARIPDRIVDVLVVRRAVLEQQAPAVRTLVKAHFKALALWRKSPGHYADIMASRLGLTPQQVAATFAQMRMPDAQENRQLLSGTPAPLLSTAQRLADTMSKADLLNTKPVLTDLLDARFVA